MKQENHILDIKGVLRKNTVAKRLKVFDFNIQGVPRNMTVCRTS